LAVVDRPTDEKTAPLDRADPIVALKLELLERATPADSAAIFGDMWRVDGAYALSCLELGCGRVVVVDASETFEWQRRRLEHPQLDFYKGDFGNAWFMQSLRERFDLTIAYDVLLHQAPLLHTLHLILAHTYERICICQPVLRERETPNTLVYLPGNRDASLHPAPDNVDYDNFFDVDAVNPAKWIWGMTQSLVRSVMAGEGFEITFEKSGPEAPNPDWFWWGCIARRARDSNPQHWSEFAPLPGIV
jgi:hypothetical protein